MTAYQPGVYMIRNTVTGRVYIGSALNAHIRLNDHRSSCTRRRHLVKAMQWDWDRYGPESFVFEILESFDLTDNLRWSRWDPTGLWRDGIWILRHAEQRWLNQIHPEVLYNRHPAVTWPATSCLLAGHDPCFSRPEALN